MGFYKCVTANYVRMGPQYILTFVFYEKLMRDIQKQVSLTALQELQCGPVFLFEGGGSAGRLLGFLVTRRQKASSSARAPVTGLSVYAHGLVQHS